MSATGKREASPLVRAVTLRLVATFGLTLGVAAVIIGTLLAVVRTQADSRAREVAREHFAAVAKNLDRDWRIASWRSKTRIEYARPLEQPATRAERMAAYLTAENVTDPFLRLVVADRDGRILFASGFAEGELAPAFAVGSDSGWYFSEPAQLLLRYFVQPIWLGSAEGMGRLVLFTPLDNGLLYRLASTEHALFLRWQGRTVASSLGDAGLAATDPAGEDAGLATARLTLDFDQRGGEVPALIVRQQTDFPLSGGIAWVAMTIALTAVLAVVWLSGWRSVRGTARRIARLDEAIGRFAAEHLVSEPVLDALALARLGPEDEIGRLGRSLEDILRAVAGREAEHESYEKRLRESEARIREIAAVLGDGVYVLDREGRVTFWNAEAERLLGWREQEILGRDGHETFHYAMPDGQPISTIDCPVHKTIMRGGSYRSLHDWLVRKDGRFLPVSIVSTPILRDGQVTGSVAAFHDISVRLDAERELRESEQRFRLLFNAGNDGILVHYLAGEDGRGRFVEANQAACRMLGYTRDELLTMSPIDLDAPESTGDMAEVAAQIHEKGQATFQRVHLAKNGQRIPVEITAHTFEYKGETFVMSVVRDVSERKEAEEIHRTIVQTALDGFLVVDVKDGRLLDANDACCELLGHSRAELLRLNLANIEAAEDVAAMRAWLGELAAGGSARFESRYRRKDGSVIDVEISARFLNIRGGVVISFVRDVSERKRAEERVRQLAYYDGLTHLANRRLLVDRLEQAIVQASRHQRLLAVMFLDLDRFKQINDTLGHDVGDELLKAVAERLRRCVRGGDTVCRQGGDEFVIVLHEVSHGEAAALVAEKILAALAEPVTLGGHALQVTTSIGIAVFPEDGEDVPTLLKNADTAMYQAKEGGRNGYRYYRPATAGRMENK